MSKLETQKKLKQMSIVDSIAAGQRELTLETASAMIDDGTAPLDVTMADTEFRRACYAAWEAKNVQGRRRKRLEMRRAALALSAALRMWGVR